ncbi:response regulator [Paenibacillus sp. YYML68]|uniref:response regulator n=1 Tax=Paenibacillus sp. YYML68 TaxID=2909250 RepID=UPI0024911371|nr:response regulator [Paenibacillus sp. YYML68]
MRIVVLDDEPIIRQGIIHKIGQTGLPVEVVGEAGDGRAGLELVRTLRPDLVVTDIHMPAMDGLTFIQEAQELNSSLRFIILSGYDDFDYAKRAIRYGVSDYLLKPLEEEELYAALSAQIERMEVQEQRLKQVEELKALAETSQEAARQQTLTQYLQDDDMDITDEAIRTLEQSCVLFTAAVLQMEPFTTPHQSFAEGEDALIWFAIKNIVTERFESRGIQGVLVHHSLDRDQLVYVLGLKEKQDNVSVLSTLEAISYGIRQYLKLNVTIGIGPYQEKLHKIKESYREARSLTRNAIVHGNNRIYTWSHSAARAAQRKTIIGNEDGKLLESWLKGLEKDKVSRWLERRLGAIAQDPESTFLMVEWFCVDLYVYLHKFLLANADESEWAIGEMEDLLRGLQQAKDWRDVMLRMNELATNAIFLLSKTNTAAGKDIMESVRLYIQHHYAESIQLQSIAERFYIHPNYFSKRFKEKYGESFVDYLNSVRMKEAAVLLSTTDLKVREISERVGFDDAAYFGSVFRKRYGQTPTQYRERMAQS